jgi:hypothetical protein
MSPLVTPLGLTMPFADTSADPIRLRTSGFV